jgi:hypothetical protein
MEASAYQPFAMALFAEGLIATRNAGEALVTLERAIAISDAKGERFYAAELRRLQAKAMRACGRRGDAERALHEAIDIAHGQQAKLFEARARELAARP